MSAPKIALIDMPGALDAPPTTVVNMCHDRYDEYIGRGSIWGNPHSHVRSHFPGVIYVNTREEAVERYRGHLISRPDLLSKLWMLKGRRLGCYCKPLACHGDILAELADYYTP